MPKANGMRKTKNKKKEEDEATAAAPHNQFKGI